MYVKKVEESRVFGQDEYIKFWVPVQWELTEMFKTKYCNVRLQKSSSWTVCRHRQDPIVKQKKLMALSKNQNKILAVPVLANLEKVKLLSLIPHLLNY